MDPYGCRAMDYVREHCPRQYAAIPDPVSFFTNMGEEMRAQVMAAEETLAHAPGGPDPTTPEGWGQRLGQANMATLMIEERVFSTMVYEAMPPEEDPEDLASPTYVWALTADPSQRDDPLGLIRTRSHTQEAS